MPSNILYFIYKICYKKILYSAPGYKSPDQYEMEIALNTVAQLSVYYQGRSPLHELMLLSTLSTGMFTPKGYYDRSQRLLGIGYKYGLK